MTDDPLTTAKHRADLWRGLAVSPVAEEYYHGLRLGLVFAGRADADEHGAARARPYHEDDPTDALRYATACGYVDGLQWDTPTAHVGLLRLAILLRTEGSARAYARSIDVDERTVRRWLAGARPIAGVTLALLQREIDWRSDYGDYDL